MESFIVSHLDILVQLVIFIILGALGFDRLRTGQKDQRAAMQELSARAEQHWQKLDDKILTLDARLDQHIGSVNPHQTCVGHQTFLTEIEARLGRVQMSIVRMESWMMHMATGRPVPPPRDE